MTLVVDITDGRGISNEACHGLHSKRCLTNCNITNKMERLGFKWAYHAGCKAYKRRLAYSVTVYF